MEQTPTGLDQQRQQTQTTNQRNLGRHSHHAVTGQPRIDAVLPLGAVLGQSSGIQIGRGDVQKCEKVGGAVDERRGRTEGSELGGALAGTGGQADAGGIDQREERAGDPKGQAGEVELAEGGKGRQGRRRRRRLLLGASSDFDFDLVAGIFFIVLIIGR